MARPLKVFRTSAGFEDVYVAATSRKAALAAWGTDKDLFARGAADLVTDPELVKQVLARPGEVIRLSRATLAQHLSAAGAADAGLASRVRAKRASGVRHEEPPADRPRPEPKPPKPSRSKVEAAKVAIEKHDAAQAAALRKIDQEIEQLRAKRTQIIQKAETEAARLEDDLAREEKDYRAALDRWAD
ncbi:MAG: hypothetical protein NTX28_01655 [Novosphingobium sp.]|nr:hypothetical protein [Novosphingobium sp.]